MQNNQEILLSIIVPVYNVEDYIEECVGSIIPQLNPNIELIIVNDGTKDKSVERIHQTIDRNSMITLINQKNMGLSAARNTGLDHARGEYVFFLDSDDFANQNSITKTENFLKDNCGIDVIVSDFTIKNEMTKQFEEINITDNIVSTISLLGNLKSPLCNVWRYIFKREFLLSNEIYFREKALCEDIEWLGKILMKEPTVVSSHINLVTYRANREGSIMSILSKERITDAISAIYAILEELKLCNVDFEIRKCMRKSLLREYLFNISYLWKLNKTEYKEVVLYNKPLVVGHSIRFFMVGTLVKVIGLQNVSKVLWFIKRMKN